MTVEVREPVREVLLDGLDPRQALAVESLGPRRGRGPTAHHQDGVVAVGGPSDLARDDPGDLARVGSHRQREGPRAVAGDVALDPVLRGGNLLAHDGDGIAAERGVPEGVIADLVAVAREVLEL